MSASYARTLRDFEFQHRLIVERELTMLERPAQLLSEVGQVDDWELHRARVEHHRAVVIGLAGGGECSPGVLEQRLRSRSIFGELSQANGGPKLKALVAIDERLGKCATDPIGCIAHGLPIPHARHQYDEQVAANPAKRRELRRVLPLQHRSHQPAAASRAKKVACVTQPAEMNRRKRERCFAQARGGDRGIEPRIEGCAMLDVLRILRGDHRSGSCAGCFLRHIPQHR